MKSTAKTFSEDELKALNDMEPDLSDIPEITEDMMRKGKFVNFKPKKKTITIRIDAYLIDALKSNGTKGYQTKINEILTDAYQSGKF